MERLIYKAFLLKINELNKTYILPMAYHPSDLSGVVKVCTFRTTACEAIGGLRVEALSGSSSRCRRSSRGKIGQLGEALFGESRI